MSKYYESLAELITKGALYRQVVFPKYDLCLKIKNPTYEDLDWTYEYSPTQAWKREIAFLSRTVHSINGRLVQTDEDSTYWLTEYFFSLSPALLSRLLSYATVLMDTSRRSHSFLEPFCYESESRHLWKIWKTTRHKDTLHPIQASWVSWNQAEDERLSVRTEWEQALLVTSAFNHKGAQEVRKNWQSEDKANEEYRTKVMTLARKGISNYESEREKLRNNLDTYDDLVEEMKRWVAGEEDNHDRIVREYKESMYRKIEDDKRRVEEMREQNARRQMDINEIRASASPVRAYTDEEIKSLSPQTKLVKETNEHLERFEHVKDRYITARETSGHLKVDENGNLISDKPQKPSLMDQLKNRTPTI